MEIRGIIRYRNINKVALEIAERFLPSKQYLSSVDLSLAIEAALQQAREEGEEEGRNWGEHARTVKSISYMLGWENVPPRETLEREINVRTRFANEQAAEIERLKKLIRDLGDGKACRVHHNLCTSDCTDRAAEAKVEELEKERGAWEERYERGRAEYLDTLWYSRWTDVTNRAKKALARAAKENV